MKGFASNLINRHIRTEANIAPRLRGMFEPDQNSFREDINRAVPNSIDTFSERINADDSKRRDPDNEPAAYQSVINTRRNSSRMQMPADPQPGPEISVQGNFNTAKPTTASPAIFGVTPVTDNFKPGNVMPDNTESAVQDEPGLPGKRKAAAPYQHNFNINAPVNPLKINESQNVSPKIDNQENEGGAAFFTGNEKSSIATESVRRSDEPLGKRVNEPVQPAMEFKSSNTGMQNTTNAVSPPNISNSNLREAGQKYHQQTAQPVIKVTIGRIEVKAVHQQAPAPVQRREPQKPALTLDDFLSQHKHNGQ